MSKPKYLPEVYTRLADEGLGPMEISRHLGDVTEASVRRGLEKAKRDGWHPRIKPDAEIVLEKPLRHYLSEGALAVTADFHFPVTDYEFVNEFLAECAQRNVKNLLIAGDFLNMDALSRFDAKQDSAGLTAELDMANKAMRTILNQFDLVYFTWGNHDARLHKALGYKVDFRTAMKMVFYDVSDKQKERLHISNLDHMLVGVTPMYELAGENAWYICHPKSYSRKPLSTALELAATKNMNIACAHSHHHAYGWDRSGRLRLVEVGGFFDREGVEYLQRTDTYPNWQNGYMILTEDNEVILRGRGVSYDGSR
jgi:predicted phosphodiesterase